MYEQKSNWAYLNINDMGDYEFTFNDLDAGVYMVLAGTDPENNGTIGDKTEAIGYYPTKADPILLLANKDISNVIFDITYQIPAITIESLSKENLKGCETRRVNPTIKNRNRTVNLCDSPKISEFTIE